MPANFATAHEQTGKKAKLLLVDDTPANLLSLQAILEELGHQIVECQSGEESLEQVQIDDFAVILLDVNMPGLSGFETARRLRQTPRSRNTPIIFLTANDVGEAELEQGYELGAVDFLVKPFKPYILKSKVRTFIELFLDNEKAKREGEQLRLLVHGTIDYAIFMLDPDGCVVTWNLGAERLKGYKSDEIIGSHLSRFYTKVDIDRNWPAYELAVAKEVGRFEDEGWRIRKDGSRFWANVVITALRDDEGNLRGFSKVTRDLTARRETEEKLRISEERFRLLVEGAKDYAIFLLDTGGRVVTWNPGAERIKQYHADEIIGQHFSRFYPQEAIDKGWPEYELQKAALDGRFEDEGWRIRKDGSQFWANVVITALRDQAGNLKGFSKITRDMTDRKRAEEDAHRLIEETTARKMAQENSRQIQEQRERLHVTLASIGDAVISTDANGEIDFLNPVAESLLGQTESEIRQRPIQDVLKIVNEHTRQPVDNPALLALSEGKTVGLANHSVLIAKDGREIFIDDSAAPIKNRQGEIIGSVLVFRDIGEKKQSQQKLRESEERLRLALEAGRMRVLDWNAVRSTPSDADETKSIFSAVRNSLDQVLEQFQQSIHPDDHELVQSAIQNAIRESGGFDFEFRTTSADREVRWIAARGKAISDNSAPTVRVVGIGSDITKRKRTEQIAAFFAEASATLAVLVDFESTVQKFAALAVPFFADWAAVDLLEGNQTLRRVAVAHHDSSKLAIAREMQRGLPSELNSDYGLGKIVRSGSSQLVSHITDQMLVRTIKDPERLAFIRSLGLRSYIGVPLKVRGKILGIVSFASAESGHTYDEADLAAAQDLAERGAVAMENARLYRELQDQDRRKDEFLATLAHELRNPLAPIRNSIQILKMPHVAEEAAQQTKDMMDRQVHHLVRLIDDLLDVSRVMRGKIDLRKEPTQISTVIARAVETVTSLIEAQGHHLEISIPSESLLVDADPVRLVQVIGNLLTNAAKYTDPHGAISLSAAREANDVVLKIRDNGIGIAPDMLPHVFELFVQADHTSSKAQGGLGIGLTLVKNLIEMHGGTVSAESAGLGRGAEFVVRLPMIAAELEQGVERIIPPESVQSMKALKLMVVDDNRDAATSLGMLLRMQGNDVQIAYDGTSAISIAREFRPTLMFLDIGMPGLDGYEVARRIQQIPELEKITLVALTGWGQDQDRQRSAEAGFDHHLVKPPEPEAITAIISSLTHA